MQILGIDIGGSGIKGAPIDTKTGKLLSDRHRIATPRPATPRAVAETVAKITEHFDWSGPIGCGFPAVVQGGVVRSAANIHASWIRTDVVELFRKITSCPVSVVNDADAAGIAERHFGAGRNQAGVVLLVTVGTGLGTAVFTNGELLPNTEFGQIIIRGQIAERYASDFVRKEEDLSWPEWAGRFNEYLTRLEFLLWPDLFIIGGGASKKLHKFEDHLSVQAKVVAAELRNEAGMVGAAMAASRLPRQSVVI